ncbi:GTPase IMAP family member 7-like isoform X2 [Argopecten irradians]
MWECDECGHQCSTDALLCENCFTGRQVHSGGEKETRLILIGKTGTGKSATGNMLLGKVAFQSTVSCGSVTKVCRMGTNRRFGRTLSVVDTPGLFDTGLDNDSITKEVLKCVGMSAPGPHAILLVISISRFTKEECDAVRMLQYAFGEEMNKYLIVVFTRKDELDKCLKTRYDIVREAPADLTALLKGCDFRFTAFNNCAERPESEQQVQELLTMVDQVVTDNKGEFYNSSIFMQTEKVLKEREEEIRKKYEQSAVEELRNYRHGLLKDLDSNRRLQEVYRNELATHQEYRKSSNEFLAATTQTQDVNRQRQLPGPVGKSKHSKSSDALHKRLQDCEKQLSRLQKHEKRMISSMNMTLLAREQMIKQKLEKMKHEVRSTVRKEVENEDRGVLRRMWVQIRNHVKGFGDSFKRIFQSKKT